MSSLNIGYRHILPVLPFAFVLAGQYGRSLTQSRPRKIACRSVGLAHRRVAVVYPDYLTYFNETVGGARGGKRLPGRSDLEWGQDLPRLRAYLAENEISEVFLSYFGTTPPEHYGIRYRPLPAWPPRGIPGQLAYHPDYPLPGVYAISAANLVGARFEDAPGTFAWFKLQEPLAVIGNSIYLYRVPRLLDVAALPVNVVLAGLNLADLPTAVIENDLHTNDLIPRWMDASQALIFPQGQMVLVMDEETAVHPLLAERLVTLLPMAEQMTSGDGTQQIQYFDADLDVALAEYLQANVGKVVYVSSSPAATLEEVTLMDAPVDFGTAVTFLGYEQVTNPIKPGGVVQLLSYWRVNELVDAPLATFVHLLAPDGSVLAQVDGLGVATQYWHPGDIIVQAHQFQAPDPLPEGMGWLALGLYRSDTLTRLPVNDMFDRILIVVDATQ
ncbi:MAG: hypothetical protein H6667_23680 [Ardenticatenaceae bacterium]|nr:hypothetical protein [Ardenticatenaceae bacterium]